MVDLPAPLGPRKPTTWPAGDVERHVADGGVVAVVLGQVARRGSCGSLVEVVAGREITIRGAGGFWQGGRYVRRFGERAFAAIKRSWVRSQSTLADGTVGRYFGRGRPVRTARRTSGSGDWRSPAIYPSAGIPVSDTTGMRADRTDRGFYDRDCGGPECIPRSPEGGPNHG